MLYRYTSLDYLKSLHTIVTQAIDGVVDPLLETAGAQGRDTILSNQQWGTRNTSKNWADNAWPMLKDLQASIAKDIAMRAFDKYKMTATDEKLRGTEQFSMQWLTAEEEHQYNRAIARISQMASKIDDTFSPELKPRWDDYGFAYCFPEFKVESPMIPKFRVRHDIAGETGKTAPRTGVYIAAGMPEAALQFAVAGNGGIKLKEASTFNEIGWEALQCVGRDRLWFDEQAMLDYATTSKHAALFAKWINISGSVKAKLAPSAVAQASFTTKPAHWFYVEEIPDEFESVELPSRTLDVPLNVQRQIGGEACKVAGFYFSPAQVNSRRYFRSGDLLPVLSPQYGETFWQWDPDQS